MATPVDQRRAGPDQGKEVRTILSIDGGGIRGIIPALVLAEIERRRAVYLGDRPRVNPDGRVVVVVDDGLATGATAKAALAAVKRQGAARIVLAVPVAPADALEEMRGLADDVVVVQTPEQFWSIGQFYVDFHQLSDAETVTLLTEAWAGP